MAVSTALGSIAGGLRPVKGSIRLVLMRLSLVVFASLPALVVGTAGVASGVARRPYYTDIEGPLPFAHWVRLFKELPPSVVPAIVVGIILAILGDQLMMAGAVKLFAPDRPADEGVSVKAAVFRDGFEHLWAFLRAALWGVVFAGIGVTLLRRLFKRLDIAGYHAGWTGLTTALRLPLLLVFLSLLWIAVAGAWVFWCRLIIAADGRRRVLRTGLLVLRVFWRHPLRSWGFFAALTSLTTVASGAALFAWRRAEPKTVSGAIGWFLFWLFVMLVQAFVWLWLVRAGRLLYASEGLADLRSRPDAPFALLRRLLWWRK